MTIQNYHAIVLIDRPAAGLGFLATQRSAAMLKVGNKPLVQIALEELYDVGLRSATIISDGEHNDVLAFVGDGSRWGLKLSHGNARHPFAPGKDAAGNSMSLIGVRGDMLRPFGLLEEALRRRDSQNAADIYTALGVMTECESADDLKQIEWSKVSGTCRLVPCLVADPAMYFQANIMALQGLVPGVRSAGRPAPDDIILGKGSRVLSSHAPAKSVVIGTRCLVEHGVVLGENVIIGNNCIIDGGAVLENCVILDGSYIGKGVVLKDKIVDQSNVYCLSRALGCKIEDRRLFARAA